jgi:hypothetical protein
MMRTLALVPAPADPADTPPETTKPARSVELVDVDVLADRADLAERLLPTALDLVMRVHDDGRQAVAELLAQIAPGELPALLVVLAALVPVDQGIADLLAWVTFDEYGRPLTGVTPALPRTTARGRRLKPCGTHAAYNRHRKLGEDPCRACETAERIYQRNRDRTKTRSRKDEPVTDLPILCVSLLNPRPWQILHQGLTAAALTRPTTYTGPVVLHAGRRSLVDLADRLTAQGHDRRQILASGHAGLATVTGCHPAADCAGSCPAEGEPGFHWQFTDPAPFDHVIEGKGRSGLFAAPPDVAALVHQRGDASTTAAAIESGAEVDGGR